MVLALGCGVARAQFTGMPSGNGADPGAVSPDGVSGRHAGAWHGHRLFCGDPGQHSVLERFQLRAHACPS
ncbi:hypothetical protein ACQUWY_26945, partial [Ralstonia pseudosolanacearum]